MDFSGFKALVIDDEDTVRAVIVENLRSMGFEDIRTARNGEEGLAQLRNEDIDIVFLDLAMPGVPGEEVAHLALGMKPEVVIIVITGFATLEKAVNLMREGIYDLVRKPFDFNELLEKITAALEKYDRARQDRDSDEEFIGPFRVVSEIAVGGGGIVYKAENRDTGDTVALKILLSGPRASEEKVLRFHREARTIQELQHPNIVSIRDVGAHVDRHYIAMDYIEGQSLRDLISEKKLTYRSALSLTVTICGAVQYAHDKGILHRDIKPSNIIVDQDWKPHIIDFGLAKSIRDNLRITQSKKLYGTLGYIAPERFGSTPQASDARLQDVFSLGVLFYEMLTNTVPYHIESGGDIIPNFACEPEDPAATDPRIPRELTSVILRSIACDPAERFSSAEAFSKALAPFLAADTEDFPLTYGKTTP